MHYWGKQAFHTPPDILRISRTHSSGVILSPTLGPQFSDVILGNRLLFHSIVRLLHTQQFGLFKLFIQAYLILFVTCITALSRSCTFYQLKVCGNPLLSKSISAIFPAAIAHFMFFCHILITFTHFLHLSLFQTATYLLSVPVNSLFAEGGEKRKHLCMVSGLV